MVLTLKPKNQSIPWLLAKNVAQLFVSAVEVSASTLTATVPVAESSSWYAAGKALGSLGQTVVSRLSPKDGQEVAISTVYQVGVGWVCLADRQAWRAVCGPTAHGGVETGWDQGQKSIEICDMPQHPAIAVSLQQGLVCVATHCPQAGTVLCVLCVHVMGGGQE